MADSRYWNVRWKLSIGRGCAVIWLSCRDIVVMWEKKGAVVWDHCGCRKRKPK